MFRSFPLSLIFSGFYAWSVATPGGKATHGNYWTSSTYDTLYTHSMYFYSASTSTNDGHPKVGGLTVRCVAHGSELNSAESQAAVATTCSAGNICYDANGGSGSMTDQSAAAGSSATLTASSFTRLGYAFAGWSTQDNGFGIVYGPNETITVPSQATLGSGNGYQLYAKWLPSTGTMQGFDSTQCANLGMHQTVALTDTRDGNVYTVTKLKDNNCWMTSNLALNLADFAGTHKLNTSNTDLNSSSALSPCISEDTDCYNADSSLNGAYWDPSLSSLRKAVAIQCPAVTNIDTKTAAQLLSDCSSITTDANGNYANGNYFEITSENYLGTKQHYQFQDGDIYGTVTENGQQVTYHWASGCTSVGVCDSSATPDGVNDLSEIPRSFVETNGNNLGYYNWVAATAETGKHTSVTASDSMCPSGWKMPTGGDNNGQWVSLIREYYPSFATGGGNLEVVMFLKKLPLSANWSGYYDRSGGIIGRRETYPGGFLWSNRSYSTNVAWELDFTSDGYMARHFFKNKSHGMSVRCALKPSTSSSELEP